MDPLVFQESLLSWFDVNGRNNLPWQKEISPYRVWISETMLQQTQVATVIPYFNRFIEKFPDINALALSSMDEVLSNWSGLGYYARARNLYKTAQLIHDRGVFPTTFEELIKLPGIGRSTAGAILSIAFNKRYPILDGNVKRVLTRFYAVPGWPGETRISNKLWQLSNQLTPQSRVADYTQAIMDLGATVCTKQKPLCGACPLQVGCQARLTNRISQFPHHKPAKPLPVKELVFLILRDPGNRILLEKRPPVGIWGGLWSFPEFKSTDSALSWCREQQLTIISYQVLTAGRHSFSHYHLDYVPLFVLSNNPRNKIMEADETVWYKADEITKIALPSPIKQLIQF